MMNVLNGGAHADNKVDFQEFMVVPVGRAELRGGAAGGRRDVPRAEGDRCKKRGLGRRVGDEGGFAPDLDSNEAALELLIAGDRGGRLQAGQGHLSSRSTRRPASSTETARTCSSTRAARCRAAELVDYWARICDRYPLVSLEDGMAEDDWDGWKALTERLGERVQLVGDDLFVTNAERLGAGIERGRRQLDSGQGEPDRTADRDARGDRDGAARPATRTMISHRSGETEDTTIADLAVATNAGQIKTGAPSRSDRIAKYNQLLRIEEELGETGHLSGARAPLQEGRAPAAEPWSVSARAYRVAPRRQAADGRRAAPLGPARPSCPGPGAVRDHVLLRKPGGGLRRRLAWLPRGAQPAPELSSQHNRLVAKAASLRTGAAPSRRGAWGWSRPARAPS